MAVLSRAEEKLLVALRRRRERERRSLFLAEGVRVVESLIASPIAIELAVVSTALEETARGAALLEALGPAAPVLRRVPDHVLARVAATETPQGIVLAARLPSISMDDIGLGPRSTLLVLDGVQDPGNFGALVRSADAFGAEAVLALTGTVDPWNPKAVRAAAGSTFHLPILGTGTAEALAWMRDRGFQLLAADPDGAPLAGNARSARAALVVGNEGAGISGAVRAAASMRVGVPTRGSAESLNVAVAAGILLYLLTREH